MDIKDLNKPQLLLLAILLSFITSIATGITTVTLMQQAPVAFTEPVNRIIKQTVEKIQQVEGKTVTQTVIIKEEDLVVDAISKNKSAVFSISKMGSGENGENIEFTAGKGFAINTDGVIVVDASWVPSEGSYFVVNDSGKFKATFLFADKAGFSFLKIGEPVDPSKSVSFTVPIFGDLGEVKIGQKVIVLGNTISSFIFDGNKEMKNNIAKSNAGGMVFDLDAEALGIALSGDNISFASIDVINESFLSNKPQ